MFLRTTVRHPRLAVFYFIGTEHLEKLMKKTASLSLNDATPAAIEAEARRLRGSRSYAQRELILAATKTGSGHASLDVALAKEASRRQTTRSTA